MWNHYKEKLIIKILKINAFKLILVFCSLFWAVIITVLSHSSMLFTV
jgi:hypothetical protein